jgi:predicted AAA+ superfamily ATPase
MLDRSDAVAHVTAALRRSQVVLVLGPRQSGKTTLARGFVKPDSPNYFDLESPPDAARLAEPMTALSRLKGTVVIDEIQRRPDLHEGLFPALRVLADRKPLPARFLVLGSAAPELLRQSSESLAGRVERVELGPFTLAECGAAKLESRWLRGGFPRSFLARSAADSAAWREDFLSALIERDLPAYDTRLAPAMLRRLWTMFAHHHGQTANLSQIAAGLGIATATVRHHLDLLTGLFVARALSPWFENVGKRQVKSPRLYFRDSGLLHTLLGIDSMKALLSNPRCGASWEGLVIEEILARTPHQDAYWWSTHQGAEIDLILFSRGKRYGVEVKRADAPGVTPSMRIAKETLGLARISVVTPGEKSYDLAKDMRVVAIGDLVASPRCVISG